MSQSSAPVVDAAGRVLVGPLRGYAIAEPGRRVVARLLDVVIGLVGQVVLYVVFFASLFAAASTGSGGFGVGMLIALAIPFVYLAYAIYVFVTRASTVGQRIMGLSMVGFTDGQKASGKAFGKTLLEELVALCTLGLGYLASWFTMQGPMHRNWLDRTVGVVVVDVRRGRRLSDGPPEAIAPPTAPEQPIPVHLARTSGAGVEPSVEAVHHESTIIKPLPADPIVTRTPWSQPEPKAEPVPGAVATHISPIDLSVEQASSAAGIRLDNGTIHDLQNAVVIGRDPVAPAAIHDAHLVALPDRTMSVSKTHLAVGVTDEQVWVRDLRSTNGVRVRGADGTIRGVQPGTAETVLPGEVVLFGERSFEVTK